MLKFIVHNGILILYRMEGVPRMKVKDLLNESDKILLENWRGRMLKSSTLIGVFFHKWRIDRFIERVIREHKQGLR